MERFLTIGNFHDGVLCDSVRTQVPVSFINCCYAYYYIDDVSLTEDTITRIDEIATIDFSLYPNPAKGNVQINSDELITEIKVMDLRQNTVLALKPQQTHTQLDISHLDAGIYFVHGKYMNGIIHYEKIIVQH